MDAETIHNVHKREMCVLAFSMVKKLCNLDGQKYETMSREGIISKMEAKLCFILDKLLH